MSEIACERDFFEPSDEPCQGNGDWLNLEGVILYVDSQSAAAYYMPAKPHLTASLLGSLSIKEWAYGWEKYDYDRIREALVERVKDMNVDICAHLFQDIELLAQAVYDVNVEKRNVANDEALFWTASIWGNDWTPAK